MHDPCAVEVGRGLQPCQGFGAQPWVWGRAKRLSGVTRQGKPPFHTVPTVAVAVAVAVASV